MLEERTAEKLDRIARATREMKVASRKFLNWLVSGPGAPNQTGIESLVELRRATEKLEGLLGQ